MKRVGIIALVMLALGAGAATAQASVRWPARCHNFKCVNTHLNALHQQALKTSRVAFVNYLYKCGIEFPESLDGSGFFFLTPAGSTPDVWALGDGCDTEPAGARRSTGQPSTRLPGVTPLALLARK
ncbi:MAG TPA: hypothetical protein VFI18_09685 [Gaiellales bacterium]|nr:hypothetical protein [Gaiellales bacterium]